MPFSANELTELEAMLAASDGGAGTVATFRSHFPGRSLTRCAVSDMGAEEPYRSFAALDLHLVDGSAHCWRITGDPAAASGVVLALRCCSP